MEVEDRRSPAEVEPDRCGQLDVHVSPEDDGVDDGDLAAMADGCKKRSYAETARMFKLRRNLDQLDCFHRQKEHDVLKAREKLKLCQQNIQSLLEQRDNLEREIEQQKVTDNSVALFRLRARHKHLCQKLHSEEELEGHINIELKQLELELSEVEVELGRCSLLRQEVQEEEQLFQVLKAQKAATRLQQEREASQNLQLKMKNLRDKQAAMLKKEKTECQRKIEEGRESRKIAAKYLKQTVKRMNQQEAERERQNQELLEKRLQAVKSLKTNIEATQENLQVQQSRARANAQKKEQLQRQLRESLQAQGINSIKHMYQQKQQQETKRKEGEFQESQKSKRVEIVSKILQEEQLTNRRQRKPALLLPKPSATEKFLSLRRASEKLAYYLDSVPPSAAEEKATIFRDFSDTSSSSSSSACSDVEDLEGTEENEEKVNHQIPTDSLAEPEFSGLWDQHIKKMPNENTTLVQTQLRQEKPPIASGKLNMTAKRNRGKELKGPPFISKPEVILFKDFDVGKMYKKKIVLTNISYAVINCKFLGVSPHLKNFFTINFQPPTLLSTGMSFDMQAIFQPMINEDLEGELQFASVLGPFFVPIRCTVKKCILKVDSQFIDFGSHVVGQTISRTITLTNKGALATHFSLDSSTCLSPETSYVQMPPQVSTNTFEASSQNTATNNQNSPESIDAEDVQSKLQSQELSAGEQQEQSVSEGVKTVPGACLSSDLDTQTDQTPSDSSDIKLKDVRGGEIEPFESVKLEIIFTPTIPGETRLDFSFKFSDKTSKPIPIHVRGVAVSMPVWVLQPNIDLKICMFDRLYQDTIMVQSRASTALKLTFEVCQDMRKHMEILPKTGFIQAQSSFSAQLKFIPRRSLSKDAKFFDSDTGVLEVPMTVQVAGQVQPAHFTVHAIVTSSDLQFDHTEVDFGYCSIYQSVKSSIRLTNLSLLPQDFGFLGVPEFIEVQPNDGFGTLLPQETLEVDLIFSAQTAKEYVFQLCCKSGINRDFLLSCRAVGVHPPLELSHFLVQFGATAVGDQSTAMLFLSNHQTGRDQNRQPVSPGVKAPVMPRLFSFALPEDSDIGISPSAGRLLPGERCLVQVTFKPRLLDQEIKEEALRRLHRAKLLYESELEGNRLAEQEAKLEIPLEPSKGKKASVNPKNSKVSNEAEKGKQSEPPDPGNIVPGSSWYEEAKASLLYSFRKRYREYTIPCFVSDGDPPEDDKLVQPAWSPFNTLYLKLQCPAVQPPLVVISNNGCNIINFHQVTVGERVIKRFTVQNISQESLDLSSSVFDVYSPFSLLNALRSIRPGEKHTLILAFSPTLGKKCCDMLEVRCQKMTLEMTLLGEGIVPAVTSSHNGDVLDFGYVLEKETASQVVKLQNSSAVPVSFRVMLASLSPFRPQGGADRVAFLLDRYANSHVHPAVGTQNYSGLSVFSVVPVEGSIPPGQSQEFTRSESEVTESPTIPVLVTLKARCSSGAITPAVRELQVGCIRSTQTIKKGGEFYWDNVASLQQQGFNVEPSKGNVDTGQRRAIRITWTPHTGYKPYEVVQMCVPLTLKGDGMNVYRVTLMALVSTTAD
ncbi:cilia- and flagella-associated protein 74 [Neolamprologus brichardi]|uniref:cilia- and flagella-associated protein 74 n=1 Tax=Neolamprologus brichardi TaxID=32507 RepID=UPI001643EBE7|nr:cilia- and flagella-associated protein 74 [Neolamprologus brichardi]